MFINYSEQTGLSIDSYRNPSASVGDVIDVARCLDYDDSGSYCCLLDGAKEALEDGEYLSQFSVSIGAIEELHDFICKTA